MSIVNKSIVNKSLYLFFLFIYLPLVIFLEGSGLPRSKETVFYLVDTAPIILLPFIIFYKDKLVFPKKLFLIIVAFLIFLFFSLFFSVEIDTSIRRFFFHLNLFLLFFFCLNLKETSLKIFESFLVFLGFFFILYGLFIKNFFPNFYLEFWNFVYLDIYQHNKLGDFLGLVVVILALRILMKNRLKDYILFFIVLYFFLISYSRTAYLSVLITIFILLFKLKRKTGLAQSFFFAFLFISTIIFFSFSTNEIKNHILNSLGIINYLPSEINKSLISGRDQYFLWALKIINERPIFGVGPGNFIYAAFRHSQIPYHHSLSSMNIFLDYFAEGGVVLGILFLFLLFYLLLNSRFHPAIVYLLISFQYYWFHLYYSILLLFFLLLALSFKQESVKEFISISSTKIALFLLIIFIPQHTLFLSDFISLFSIEKAFYFNPFNKKSVSSLIKSGDKNPSELSLAWLTRIASADSYYLNEIANIKKSQGKKKEALKLLYQAYYWNPFMAIRKRDDVGADFLLAEKIYRLEKSLNGENQANKFFQSYIIKLSRATKTADNTFLFQEIPFFCFKEKIYNCPFFYFYTPKPLKTENTGSQLPINISYHFNKDGLNERYDYPKKKDKEKKRILILGDYVGFGFLVKTSDNWTEKLEEMLNSQIEDSKDKFEVINLSYHSYDLAYAIERFRRQGIKYQPDLIIFMNSNFYRINEIFLPLTEKYSYLENNLQEKERFRKEGKYFPSWDLAWEEYLKKVKEDEVYQRQKDYLKEFFSLYKGKVLFISLYEIPKEIKDFIKNYSEAKVIELLNFPKNKNFYYKEIPLVINPGGHEKLAEKILEFLRENFFNSALSNTFPQ